MTASLLVLLAGCAPEDLVASFGYEGNDERNLTLTLQFEGHDSRAVKTESELNENVINKVDLFLYPTNVTENAAIVSKTLRVINEENTAEGFVRNTDGSVTVKIKVSSSAIKTLFPNGVSKCDAYAIANGPEIGNTVTSISGLKGMTITSIFANGGIQESFVMDGKNEITLKETNGKKSLEGEISLVRAAAKITLKVAEIVNDITEGDVKWFPQTDGMKVFFYNGVKESKLSATTTNASSRFNLPFGANGIEGYTFASSIENSKTVYDQEIPFYSYPSDWTSTPNNEAYLVLLLPWKKEGAAQWTSFYYKIPISHVVSSTSYSKMERNTHYQINITVGILGAEEDKGEVVLTPKYTLLNWGEQTVNATLDKAHYLVVDKKEVKVYNKNQVEIGYKASEDISVVITKIEREDLSGNNVGTTTFFPKTGETSASTVAADREDKANKYTFMKACSVSKNNKSIILSHNIVNEDEDENTNADGYKFSNDDYDFTPYHITLLVTMSYTDGNGQTKTMTEEIKVIQYPAMYIVASQNSDYNDNSANYNDESDKDGYVYINNRNSNIQYGSITGLSGNNANPNMYIITTTALDKNSEYILGDPRYTEINNLKNNDWATAPAIYNGTSNRKLQYYYPTREDAKNMISPLFRIASSYGKTEGITFDIAKKRCASYQEDGYPAGRWRVPTFAEISYISKLSAEGKIPLLFNNGGNYWNASGTICSPNSTTGVVTEKTSGSNVFVRCVYDEWYWGSDQIANKSTFTWGDAPRATTSN